MDRIKKGLLFSLSIFLICSSLLYLVMSISSYVTSISSTTSSLSYFESVNSQFDAVEYDMKQIIFKKAMNVSFVSKNISFETNTSRLPSYFQDMANFQRFLQVYKEVNVTTTVANTTFTAKIIPQQIAISYNSTDISFTPQNYLWSAGEMKSYDLIIKTNIPTPRFNWTNSSELGPGNPNAIYFHVGLQGSNGTITTERYLDKYEYSRLDLLNQQNLSIIRFEISSPAVLSVRYNLDTYIKITVGLNSTSNVEVDSSIITVSMGSKGEKSGKVIINEG